VSCEMNTATNANNHLSLLAYMFLFFYKLLKLLPNRDAKEGFFS
jgi:hypothetical protein